MAAAVAPGLWADTLSGGSRVAFWATMGADANISALIERLVGCSQVSSFDSEAGRRRCRLPGMLERSPAGPSAPSED